MKSLRVSIPLFLLVIALLLPASVSIAQEIPSFEGQIAYVGTDNNIWIVRGENGENVRVTNDSNEQINYLSPRYSPDGTMLAYCQTVYGEQTVHNLFITRVGEWQPILITDDLLCQHWAKRSYDWSPDSKKIIYNLPSNLSAETRNWENYHGIRLVDITTGESSEVIPPPSTNPLSNPHWSPDGAWIKFYEISQYSGLNSLMTGENQTGTIYNWLGAGSVWPGASDWSPNSSEIVFDEVPYTGYSGAGLYLASPKGENIRRIYSSDGFSAQQPRWSPNGSTIAFLSKPYSGGLWSLMLVNPDGNDPRAAYSSENRVVPVVWSPSGDKILFGTRTEDSIELVIHDLNDSSNHSIGVAGAWEADWSLAIMDSGKAQEEIVIPDFPYSDSLMIFVAPDHSLVLYDPNDGSEIALTEPLVVSSFYPSPSGRQFVYGRHLVSLDFQENGELRINEILLPASPSGEQINWSQNEQRLSFMDWRGKFWIADLNGDAQQIPEATSIPIWSSDSALVGFCVDDNNLRVIGGEIEAANIADSVDCEINWSPTKNILAFTKLGKVDSGSSLVYLYDTTTGETTQILEQGEVVSWSPDGKFLAIKSNIDATNPNTDYEIIIITPDGERMLNIGEMQDRGIGLIEWTLTDSGYLYGPYAIAADLSSAAPIADSLLSSSKSGRQLLVRSSELHLEVLACRDSATGDDVRLLTVDLNEIPEEDLPGIWGWISPDGSRVINRSYIDGNFANMLLSCDGEVQANLPFDEFPDIASFSDNGNWFVATLNRNGERGHILLSNLEEGEIERLANLPGSNFTWLSSMELAGVHTVSGRVTTEEGNPLTEVSVFVAGVETGRVTRGHRFLAPRPIVLEGDRNGYVEALRKGFVIVEPHVREQMIEAELVRLEKESGASVRTDLSLVREVSFLVEYPVAVCGRFDEELLEVPAEVIVSAMRSHQRYFAFVDGEGQLVNRFAAVAGTVTRDLDVVRHGNERVLAARLADAQFFFREDQKHPLDYWAAKLDDVLFQGKLGSMGMKTARLVAAAGAWRADAENRIPAATVRAAKLSKADLTTHMVGEFPDLQGIMGGRYAAIAGEPPEVCDGIREHYQPRGANDPCPSSAVGAALAIVDRMDSLVGGFAVGLQPSGSADPYGLRRAAVGILAILLDRGWHDPLSGLVAAARKAYGETISVGEPVVEVLMKFFRARLKVVLVDGHGIAADCVDAALAVGFDDVVDTRARAQAVAQLRIRDDFTALSSAFKRVANILKGECVTDSPDPKLFTDAEERALWAAFCGAREQVGNCLGSADYRGALAGLASLKQPIDQFFERVLVMAKQTNVRANRLALLGSINATFMRIADFRQLSE